MKIAAARATALASRKRDLCQNSHFQALEFGGVDKTLEMLCRTDMALYRCQVSFGPIEERLRDQRSESACAGTIKGPFNVHGVSA